MHIAILDLCLPHAEFDRHGTIAEMVLAWISPHMPDATFTSLHIANGVALPGPADFDGYILTGSEKGVYDEADWMAPLRLFLLDLKAARIPTFGVCFGHQIMADTYGGKAEKVDKGFVVGAKTYQSDAGEFAAHAMHQDQVTAVPPGATVTASASYCPVAALAYDFPAASIQFHPEYRREFVSQAVDIFEGELIDADEATASRASFAIDVAEDLQGAEAAAFFRNALAR